MKNETMATNDVRKLIASLKIFLTKIVKRPQKNLSASPLQLRTVPKFINPADTGSLGGYAAKKVRASEWQPIETAPKDQWLLLYNPSLGPLPAIGRWNLSLRIDGKRNTMPEPTHWMPLPEPPQ